MCAKAPTFADLSYQKLAVVTEQWPIIGRSDLYYGGTTYENRHGLGVELPLVTSQAALGWPVLPEVSLPRLGLLAVPVTRLYDHGTTLKPTTLLEQRIPTPYVSINPADAERLRIPDGAAVRISPVKGSPVVVSVRLDTGVPERILLVPRSFGLAIEEPTAVEVLLAEKAVL